MEWISDDNNELVLENRDETSGDDGNEEDMSDSTRDGSESSERGGSGNIASDGVTDDAPHMTLEQDVVVSSCNFIPLSKVISHILFTGYWWSS